MTTALSRELELLLLCSGNRVHREALANIDWDLFVPLIRRHRVSGVVKPALDAFQDALPAKVSEAVNALYRENVIRTLQQLQLLGMVCKQLDSLGIEYLLIKGLSLATHYHNLPDRHSGDIDLLVRNTEDLWKASEALNKLGAERKFLIQELTPSQQREFESKRKDITHLYEPYQMSIELHSRLFSDPDEWFFSTDDMFLSGESTSVQGTGFRVLGGDALFLYLLLHGGLCRWFRLKWIFDIHLLSQSMSAEDFDRIHKLSCAQGVERGFLFGMQMLHILFARDLSTAIRQSIELQPVVYSLCTESLRTLKADDPSLIRQRSVLGRGMGTLRLAWHGSKFKPEIRYKLRKFALVLYSDWDWVLIPLPGYLHFLYWPLKPVTLMMRVLKKPR